MKLQPTHRPSRCGFTVTEVLVAIAMLAVLALLVIHIGRGSIEKARHAVDIGTMRQIGSSIVARSIENGGICYTKDEVGNSMYREWNDPLSLCQVLGEFLPGEESWIGPAATKRHRAYRNSYAWSVSPNVTSKHLSQIAKPQNTILLWNNFGYTLPSVYNVPEGTTAGPRLAGKAYHVRPWNRGRSVNWFYLDGHVSTF
jgi:prepilin-type N-terminal cleavage/methylation domain-containing protein/prepilin-type processing-associated H-X9-DG protein